VTTLTKRWINNLRHPFWRNYTTLGKSSYCNPLPPHPIPALTIASLLSLFAKSLGRKPLRSPRQ
jgi:hypothetical protein